MGRKAALPGGGSPETKASKSGNGENIAFSLAKHCFFRGETQYFNKMRKDNVTMLKIK